MQQHEAYRSTTRLYKAESLRITPLHHKGSLCWCWLTSFFSLFLFASRRENMYENVLHMFCWLTSEDAEDSSGDGDLGLGLFGGRADLDALESEHSHDDGAEAEQQRDDHQGATRLHVTCTEEETDSPQRQWTSERSFSSLQRRQSLCMLIFCRTVRDETDDHNVHQFFVGLHD